MNQTTLADLVEKTAVPFDTLLDFERFEGQDSLGASLLFDELILLAEGARVQLPFEHVLRLYLAGQYAERMDWQFEAVDPNTEQLSTPAEGAGPRKTAGYLSIPRDAPGSRRLYVRYQGVLDAVRRPPGFQRHRSDEDVDDIFRLEYKRLVARFDKAVGRRVRWE